MKPVDFVVIAVIVLLVVLAIISIRRQKKRGGCSAAPDAPAAARSAKKTKINNTRSRYRNDTGSDIYSACLVLVNTSERCFQRRTLLLCAALHIAHAKHSGINAYEQEHCRQHGAEYTQIRVGLAEFRAAHDEHNKRYD